MPIILGVAGRYRVGGELRLLEQVTLMMEEERGEEGLEDLAVIIWLGPECSCRKRWAGAHLGTVR